MVDTIKISALPTEISPTSDDIVPMVDGATSATKNVAFDEFGKAINYSNSLSTDANNLLAVDGSNKLNLTAGNELISSDGSNTLSVGSDGKLYGSATALSLNENELFVGNASNQPVSTSANDVRQVLGLPTDYIKDDIQYVSANQVSWEGKCRDSSDSRDFEIVGATTASLVGATANTTYNLFVAGNTLTDAPVVVWDTGSTPAGYTYYRRVLSIITDGIGNILEFTTSNTIGGSLYIIYNSLIRDLNAIPFTVGNQDVSFSVPNNVRIKPILTWSLVRTSSGTSTAFINKQGNSGQIQIGSASSGGARSSGQIQFIDTSNGIFNIEVVGSEMQFFLIDTNGYIDERN